MKHKYVGVTPVLSTPAGASLTTANWQAAKVASVSFHLAALLMKPGWSSLEEIPNLASYVGWSGPLVLNAALPQVDAQGFYALRSQYDGQYLQYPIKHVLALMAHLKPTVAILPEGLSLSHQRVWQAWPDAMMPFVPVNDLAGCREVERHYGVYFPFDETKTSPSVFLEQLMAYRGKPRYVAGFFDRTLIQALIREGVDFIESDTPAKDACVGVVYCNEGALFLQSDEFSNQHQVIEPNCDCPTCSQSLTRAYLHHLLAQTPLLCQRLLVQHNLYYCQTMLETGVDDTTVLQ